MMLFNTLGIFLNKTIENILGVIFCAHYPLET